MHQDSYVYGFMYEQEHRRPVRSIQLGDFLLHVLSLALDALSFGSSNLDEYMMFWASFLHSLRLRYVQICSTLYFLGLTEHCDLRHKLRSHQLQKVAWQRNDQ
ncbi:hypothetical protein HYQ45_015900 [Verticillium longisporum]|uniref:Uncharacterized protein n=1 Tax=Verticillium longisporum TaxID=100787 RepID=A0A8I3AJR2_VERLO|nr:hypothetical protein HYQ45_015900 [Verticillium longisporum]